MTRKLRAVATSTACAVRAGRARLDLARYTLLQLLGLALVVSAVEMVSTPLAVGLAGVAIFAAAYFLDADDGADDDQPRP